jgi:hypothetical protein
VFCTISGYGMTGPYAELPSHGIAYDTWAGPREARDHDENGFCCIPEHPSTGIHAGPCSVRSASSPASSGPRDRRGLPLRDRPVRRRGLMDWYRSETWKAYERPESR